MWDPLVREGQRQSEALAWHLPRFSVSEYLLAGVEPTEGSRDLGPGHAQEEGETGPPLVLRFRSHVCPGWQLACAIEQRKCVDLGLHETTPTASPVQRTQGNGQIRPFLSGREAPA